MFIELVKVFEKNEKKPVSPTQNGILNLKKTPYQLIKEFFFFVK
jgi:hypothetical protein